MGHLCVASVVQEYERGLDALRDGDCEQAVTAFTEALRRHPRYLDAQLALVHALFQRGDDDEAIAACELAVQWEPRHPLSLGALALAYFAVNKIDAGFEYWERAEEAGDAVPIELGLLLAERMRVEDEWHQPLLTLLTALVNRVPKHVELRMRLCAVLVAFSMYHEAYQHLDYILSLEPACADAHYYLGVIALGLGAPEKAVAALSRARTLAPPSARTDVQLAQAYHALGQRDLALAMLDAVESHAPEMDSLKQCAKLYLQMELPDHAIAVMRKILTLPDPDQVHLFTLATIARETRSRPVWQWLRNDVVASDDLLMGEVLGKIERALDQDAVLA